MQSLNLLNCLTGNHADGEQAHSCLVRTQLQPDCPAHPLQRWLLCFGVQVGHWQDPPQPLDQQCPRSEGRGCGALHSMQQHLAQRQGSLPGP